MEFRKVGADEVPEFFRTTLRTLGFPPPSEEQQELRQRHFRSPRSLAAFDGGRVVGTTYSHLFELTLPGGTLLPVAGVTAVSVITTHRRRGILTELMRRQLLEARERGEAAAVLLASEGEIYGRFGYGPSSWIVDLELDVRDGVPAADVSSDGRVGFVEPEDAYKLFPPIFERYRRTQPGEVSGPDFMWEYWKLQPRKDDEHLIVFEGSEGPEGYALYNLKTRWEAGLPQYKMEVRELTAATPAASEGLWRHCLSVDLVRRVTAGARSTQEPLRWLLPNPRAARVTRYGDLLWTRPLDVPALLSARRYLADLDVVLEVEDGFLDTGGRFRLEASPDGARCEAGGKTAEATLSVSALGAISLGGTSPGELARVGRIQADPRTVQRLEAAFASVPRPWNSVWF